MVHNDKGTVLMKIVGEEKCRERGRKKQGVMRRVRY